MKSPVGPAEGYTSDQARQALKEVAEEVLPADMNYAWNAMSFQEEKASGSLMMILTFSLVFRFSDFIRTIWRVGLCPLAFYLELHLLFLELYLPYGRQDSLVRPLKIIFSLQVSFVMLIGMAAKNAILIVEFANDEFKKGLSLFDAAMAASKISIQTNFNDCIFLYFRGISIGYCFRGLEQKQEKLWEWPC